MKSKLLFIVIVLFILLPKAYCQNKLYKYVDIHNHITLKNYLRSVESPDSTKNISKNNKYDNWYSPSNNFSINAKSNEENFYQGDFASLAESGFKTICISITPIEQNSVYNYVKRMANSGFETSIPEERLKAIYKSTPIQDFLTEMKFLKSQKSLEIVKGEKFDFKVVNNKQDMLDCINQRKTALVTTIEGGHVLYGKEVTNKDGFLNPNCPPALEKEILDNVNILKNYDSRILFMGVCHLFANKIAGHAKALDIGANSKFNSLILQKFISISKWIPGVNKLLDAKYYEGLRDGNVNLIKKNYKIDNSKIGYKVLRALLDTNNVHKKPILIDIKHMDIQSRLDYYAMLDSVPAYKHIPIICSHGAASGKNEKIALITGGFPYYDNYFENRKPVKFYRQNWKLWKEKYGVTDADYPSQVGFLNPFSINLYDEEIKRIYDSNGLIGLILEQRTLGNYMNGYNWERNEKLTDELQEKYHLTDAEVTQYFYTEPFVRNLFYFAEKSGRKDATAFDALCLGSDMDGFIDPINSCVTSDRLPSFIDNLEKIIPIYLQVQYGNDNLLYGLTPKQIIAKVFSDNAQNFILNHL